MLAHRIIASVTPLRIKDVALFQFRATEITAPAVFLIDYNGVEFYAVSKTKPEHSVGFVWEEHCDQSAARGAGTFLWVAQPDLPEATIEAHFAAVASARNSTAA